MNSINHQQIKNSGLIPCQIELPKHWVTLAKNKDYETLSSEIADQLQGQSLWHQINDYLQSIYLTSPIIWEFEWMLAQRQGPQDEDQEGIWHDDSSRDLALSLSLNLEPELISGGELRLRSRSNREEVTSIQARPWGHGHIFATGKWDWEHKTSIVTTGNRLVLVVWITKNTD